MKTRANSKIPPRNRSPFGWWIASYVERFEWKSEDRTNLNRRCLAWENTILIRAKDRETAYRKALNQRKNYSGKWGRYGKGDGRPGRWVFEGLTSLLAVYEKLEDGAELLWREHTDRSVKKIRSFVKKKSELETFID